jgi:HEAT repeat protein
LKWTFIRRQEITNLPFTNQLEDCLELAGFKTSNLGQEYDAIVKVDADGKILSYGKTLSYRDSNGNIMEIFADAIAEVRGTLSVEINYSTIFKTNFYGRNESPSSKPFDDAFPKIEFRRIVYEMIRTLWFEKSFFIELSTEEDLKAILNDKSKIESVVQEFLSALNEQVWTPKRTQRQIVAAKALGTIKDPKAVETLINVLRRISVDEIVAVKAAQALGNFKDSRIFDLILTKFEYYTRLNSTQPREWNWARDAMILVMGELGDIRALEPLTKLLEGHSLAAAQALRKFKTTETVKPLLKAFNKEENKEIRYEIKMALSEIGSEEVVEEMRKFLNRELSKYDSKKYYRVFDAVEILGIIRSSQAVNLLIEVMRKLSVDIGVDVKAKRYEKVGFKSSFNSRIAKVLIEIGTDEAIKAVSDDPALNSLLKEERNK